MKTPNMSSPHRNVARAEYLAMASLYRTITDCLKGQGTIKEAGERYLPRDKSILTNGTKIRNGQENLARQVNTNDGYDAYLARAVFYGVTGRTLAGLLGQIFLREPTVELPTLLEPLRENADGDELGLDQIARAACADTISHGRAGLWVDFPTADENGNLSGEPIPVIREFNGIDIVDWRLARVNGKTMLTQVILYELYDLETTALKTEKKGRYIVLKLFYERGADQRLTGEPVYKVGYTDDDKVDDISKIEFVTPIRANQTTFDYIPFTFVGSENNDATVDVPPLGGLAELNIAHYRNSADYETSSHIAGQATPVLVGVDQSWMDEFYGGGIQLGTRTAIALPREADFKMVQAEPNSQPKEAMDAKENQMVALGARLVDKAGVQRTAFESALENTTDNSVLGTIARNVSEAVENALGWAFEFVSRDALPDDAISYVLNSDFEITKLQPEEQKAVIGAWQNGAISFTEMRHTLRRAGLVTQDDAEAQGEIDAEAERRREEIQRTIDAMDNPDDDENNPDDNEE